MAAAQIGRLRKYRPTFPKECGAIGQLSGCVGRGQASGGVAHEFIRKSAGHPRGRRFDHFEQQFLRPAALQPTERAVCAESPDVEDRRNGDSTLRLRDTESPSRALLILRKGANDASLPPATDIDFSHRQRSDHVMTYVKALKKAQCENVEATLRKRMPLFAAAIVRQSKNRPPKRVMFGAVPGG